MSKVGDIRAGIKTVLETVTDIGRIYDYQLIPDDDTDSLEGMLESARYQGRIRVWHFFRQSQSTTQYTAAGPSQTRAINEFWAIQGIYEKLTDGASEKDFDDLVELIRAAFLADPTLGGTVTESELDGNYGPQIERLEPADFLGVICHFVQLTLPVRYYEV